MTATAARDALTKVPTGMAAKLIGLDDPRQIYTLEKRGEIEGVRTRTGRLLWDVAAYLEREAGMKGRAKGA
jgi:hypothetical protein